MRRMLVLLVIGIALGYWIGFQDAQTNTHNVVSRLVQHVTDRNRSRFDANNVDSKMDSLSR
ncbi:MAG TPA: hypothetical protein VFW98_15115 [Gemmatimonadaceae bacterium]|nr:hypothetical protein [Gemmatimonadaceae bacterium]